MQCIRQMKDRRRRFVSKKDVVLSISLMASNRKDTIQNCLDSLTPIRDAVPSELIVLDTGCEEELHERLAEYADVLERFTWCNDFSKARNECIKYASGQWFLYLDDDEWFVDTKEIIRFFQSGEYRNYGSASYIQRNFLDMEATQYTDTWVGRMIRLEPDTHFESRIHEYLAPVRGGNKHLRSIVHHFGYVYPDEAAKMAHFERNRVLLEEMIREEPEKLRWRLQLVQEYRSIDDYASMYSLGKEGLELTMGRDSFADHVYLGTFYASMILAQMGQQQYGKAKQICRQAEADVRNTELCHAFLYLSLARSCFYLGEYRESENCARRYLERKEWFDRNQEMLYQQQAAPFVGECFDEVKQKEIYSLLICDGLKQKDTTNLRDYLGCLKWDEQHIYIFEEMADTLIEAMSTMPREDIFDETIRLMCGHGPLWEYFCGEIGRWEKEGNDMTSLAALIQDAATDVKTQESATEQALQGDAEAVPAVSGGGQEELQELAEQIKLQLNMLIANGMTEQAKAIIGQVRAMLPEDGELAEMERRIGEII